MIADQLTIHSTDVAAGREIFVPVHNEPCEANEITRASAAFEQQRDDVRERLACLANEIRSLELSAHRIPSDLSGEHDKPSRRDCTIGVSAGTRPSIRLNDRGTSLSLGERSIYDYLGGYWIDYGFDIHDQLSLRR
jgi:hypothetical protein